jgi:hypothetical protein
MNKDDTNRRVANLEGRKRLRCDRCPPHRAENAFHKRNHGQKPKARIRRGA